MAEIEYTGMGSRLGKSCLGVVIGIVLFLISFPLLFWNEGRAVHRARTLAEGKAAGVDVSPDKVDEANEGKLVHVSGEATPAEPPLETLTDPVFGVSAKALELKRTVEIYQWTETTKTEKKK